MKVFLDANILISVLNKEYPLFTYTSRILGLADDPAFKVFTTPLSLSIAFYFAEKKSGTTMARQKMAILSEKLHIAAMDSSTVKKASEDKKIKDFEDAMQYYAALAAGCKCIVTEDQYDYYFSKIETLSAREFIEKYVLLRLKS